MNVHLEQVVALNYATTQLEATNALVTLATHLLQTTKHAMVGENLPLDIWIIWIINQTLQSLNTCLRFTHSFA